MMIPIDIKPKWALVIPAFVVFHILSRWTNRILIFWLVSFGLNVGLSFFVISIFQVLLIPEIFGKFLILQAVKPPRFEATKVENWPHVNLDALTYYTDELQKLGFRISGDYTAPSVKGMMRLFSHPELGCFAQVGQLTGHQIFCTISSELEEAWGMSVTNLKITADYAVERLPRKIHRYIPNATPAVLLETLLDLQSQVTKDLSIQPLKDSSVELFFAQSRKRFIKMRRRILFRSVVWGLLDDLKFKLKPYTEWLGDYPKIKARRAKA
jgi:hypothetical protein